MKRPIGGSLWITVLLMSILCPSFAQQNRVTQSSSILVNVLDRHGNAVRDLGKANFRVRVNGKPAQVLDARYSLAPRRIVVLLDMSGSMAGNSEKNKKWQIAREAVEDLLEQTPVDVPIALFTFSDRVHDVFDLSQSRSSLAAWLKQGTAQRSSIKGRTALRDAVLQGIKVLNPPRAGDAIYAITDGGDNASHASAALTKRALLESGVRLFVFAFREHYFTDEERLGGDEMEEMVRDSGGFVFGIASRGAEGSISFLPSWNAEYDYNEKARDAVKLYTQALNIQVNGFYTLRLDSPASRKESKVKLDLVEESGATQKNVAFTYQRILPARK